MREPTWLHLLALCPSPLRPTQAVAAPNIRTCSANPCHGLAGLSARWSPSHTGRRMGWTRRATRCCPGGEITRTWIRDIIPQIHTSTIHTHTTHTPHTHTTHTPHTHTHRRPHLHLPVTCHLNNSNGMCLNPEDLASEMARYATSNVFAVCPPRPSSSNDRWCSWRMGDAAPAAPAATAAAPSF